MLKLSSRLVKRGMNASGSTLASLMALLLCAIAVDSSADASLRPLQSQRPNIVLILADDLGFSDLGCYGSEVATPNLDRLAANGLRFSQFYNAARCCPTRAALLTGLYPHQAGVGHMTGDWTRFGAAYSPGLNEQSVTIAELLGEAGYRNYLSGKWHVGGRAKGQERNFPTNRGFDRFYGTFGGGDFFAPDNLYLDQQHIKPEGDYYFTDKVTEYGLQVLADHDRDHKQKPVFLHLCYTAPHFPLHARPEEIARYKGKFRAGWDVERQRRFDRMKKLGLLDRNSKLSPRDPVAQPWSEAQDKEEWDLRMAVHAAMIDRMDQGIGRVLEAVKRMGAPSSEMNNTLVLFLSDNGASAEYLDSWPDPRRGHKPGTPTGQPGSHRTLEIAWANAANTPFRENKMWIHEGGIATPLIAYWPAGIRLKGKITRQVGHVIDLMPTLLEVAGASYPKEFKGRALTAMEGRSLAPVFQGKPLGSRTLAWEHEGNRGIRDGDWKLVATFRGAWELYDLAADRTETNNLASSNPAKAKELADRWQAWADRVGVVPWERLPGSSYKPAKGYRRKSEPVAP